MKKVLIIVLALLMVIPFASCGSKSDKIMDKIIEYGKEELDGMAMGIAYDDFEWITEEMGIEQDPVMVIMVEGGEHYEEELYVFEFQKDDDAKDAEKDLEEFAEDNVNREWIDAVTGETVKPDDFIVVRKGNTVVVGTEDFVNYVTK